MKLILLFTIITSVSLIQRFNAANAQNAIFMEQNHKPQFVNCTNYAPTVPENSPVGTSVIQVKAFDEDPEDQPEGQISYSIIKQKGMSSNFNIDNRTGVITTNAKFDRDEPIGQKELYVSIQASDNGKPGLKDICILKVIITDENDNVPIFDRDPYEAKMPKDLTVNSEVLRVLAYDYDDGKNSELTYMLDPDKFEFNEYFRIDETTGVIYLKKVVGTKDKQFHSSVTVRDNGVEPQSASVDVTINVVESNKKPPTLHEHKKQIEIDENLNDYEKPLFTITAESNAQDPEVAFTLTTGKTLQTNKDYDFNLKQVNNTAFIHMARPLDYEKVPEYNLQLRVQNKDSLSATTNLVIKLRDVNDESPHFIETLLKGSVVENGFKGMQAMTIRAADKDGTSPNNLVFYELANYPELFEIDRNTGVITTKTSFDREEKAVYFVTVKAYDGAPSSRQIGGPNKVEGTFEIDIEDQNDNPPKFENKEYVAKNIKETANIGQIVIEVKATDEDTDASVIKYSIIEGDPNGDFEILETLGRIRTAKRLDFEKVESYNLTIKATDGIYSDTAKVIVHIFNENDEPPKFLPYNKTIPFREESISRPGECILTLTAYDPDIKDRDADQQIVYDVVDQKDFLAVSKTGCVTIIKKLDRDPPNGHSKYQGFIRAHDNNNIPPSLDNHTEIIILLEDINDNAPILEKQEVVWYENRPSGNIMELTAIDYDTPENGPPFKFELLPDSSSNIEDKFQITGRTLIAKVTFDREEQKYYDLKIRITDNGNEPLSGISILRVIIGDENDNLAKDGSSETFVYKYEKLSEPIEVGRVYVDDPDDWDLPDKSFHLINDVEGFRVRDDDGMIIMDSSTLPGQYNLTVNVTELQQGIEHTVKGKVLITVEEIPEEAVVNSGSIRLTGLTKEDFVKIDPILIESKRVILQNQLADLFNISNKNVAVMTAINPHGNTSLVDVRFSAHSSPWYEPERLNNRVLQNQDAIERSLNAKITMVSINECLNRTQCGQNGCRTELDIQSKPAVVFTNKTSFVGIGAYTNPICECLVKETKKCLHGGDPIEGTTCNCPTGFDGARCESLCISFMGRGWAMYPSLDSCNRTEISVHVFSQTENGLIFYVGPVTKKQAALNSDFISLELSNGQLNFKRGLNNTTETIVYDKKKIVDGARHKIRIILTANDVEISTDDCTSECLLWKGFQNRGLLVFNGPLQVGGRIRSISDEESKLLWDDPPTFTGFTGSISNFTYNQVLLDLGFPADSENIQATCAFGVAQAVTFGIDSNFLVAILVCIAILLILLLAVVVQKRKQDNQNEKDMDDTRENIIDYEDEGGGECDTSFDLDVLRKTYDEKPVENVPADISTFLDNKKHACDKDNLPYDDVRHYGYEGDGNTSGSLSSLASGTDDTDCDMNYLSSFGPRFRKLADMYGDDASEEENPNCDGESWC